MATTPNGAEALRDIIQKNSKSKLPTPPDVPDGTPPADPNNLPTTNFGGGAKPIRKAKTEAELALDRAEVERTSNIANRIKALSVSLEQPRGKLQQCISRSARICGYIVQNPPKIDFYHKSKKSKSTLDADNASVITSYEIGVRQAPPSRVEGVIVRYPANAYMALDKVETLSDEAVVDACSENQSSLIRIEPFANMASILTSKARGYLVEDEQIFEPYVSKSTKVNRYGDAPQIQATVPNKPAIYVQVKTRSQNYTAESVIKVRHTYRLKLPTPKSMLSLRQFDTIPIQQQYSPEEARNMISMYLAKLTESNKASMLPIIQRLDTASKNFFQVTGGTVDSPKPEIVSTTFFPTAGMDSWWNSHKVYSWYNKDANGAAVPLSPSEIRLVKREWNAPKNTVCRVVTRELKDTNASPDAYHFEPNGVHKAIVDATGGALKYDDIALFKPIKASKSSTTRKISAISAGDLAGVSLDAILEILSKRE